MSEFEISKTNIEQFRKNNPEYKTAADSVIISIMTQEKRSVSDMNNSIYSNNSEIVIDDKGIILEKNCGESVSVSNPVIVNLEGKSYNLNDILSQRVNKVPEDLDKAKSSDGFIGTVWGGFKNLTGIGDSSDKVLEKQKNEKNLLIQFNTNEQTRNESFKALTGEDYTPENLEKFVKGELLLSSEKALWGYIEGQEMALDVSADMISGIAALGIYTLAVAAAPLTGGASIALGVAAAAGSGALIKTSLKYVDAKTGNRNYDTDNLVKDLSTGAFSGVLAPVTGGLGGAVGKTVATKLGVQTVKQVGKELVADAAETGVKQGLKSILTNPTGYEYVGGNVLKRGLALGTEMTVDGAISGAADNAFRTGYDGGDIQEVGEAALEGFVAGTIMSPLIGGGIKVVGKGAHKILNKKNNVDVKFDEVPLKEKFDDIYSKISSLADEDDSFKPILNSINEENVSLAEALCSDEKFPKDLIANILHNTNSQKLSLAKKLCFDKDFPKSYIANILYNLYPDKLSFVEKLCFDKKFPVAYIERVAWNLNDINKPLANKICFDKNFNKEYVSQILHETRQDTYDLATKLCSSKDFPQEIIAVVLSNTNKVNAELTQQLCFDKDFPKYLISKIISTADENNIGFLKELCLNKNFPKEYIYDVMKYSNNVNFKLAKNLCMDNDFPKECVVDILRYVINEDNLYIASKLCLNKDFPKKEIPSIIFYSRPKTFELIEKLSSDKDFPKEFIAEILRNTNESNFSLANKLCSDKNFPKEHIADVLLGVKPETIDFISELINTDFPKDKIHLISYNTNKENLSFAKQLCFDKDFPKEYVGDILNAAKHDPPAFVTDLCFNIKDFPRQYIKDIVKYINDTNLDFAKDLCLDTSFPKEYIGSILKSVKQSNLSFAKKLCSKKDFPKEYAANILTHTRESNIDFTKMLCSVDDFPKEHIGKILKFICKDNYSLAKKMCLDKNFPKEHIANILSSISNEKALLLAKKLCFDKNFPKEQIANILNYVNDLSFSLANKLCSDKNFPKGQIPKILLRIDESNLKLAEKLCSDKKVSPELISNILEINSFTNQYKNLASLKYAQKLELYDYISKLEQNDRYVCEKYNLNINKIFEELSLVLRQKRNVINTTSEKQKLFFSNILSNNNSDALKILRKFDFGQYEKKGLPLKYSRSEFIKNIDNLLLQLPSSEQNKLLKHFGFEKNQMDYDGLANNSNYEEMGSSDLVKQIAEKIKLEIEHFTIQNEVITGDAKVDELLTSLVQGFPEFTLSIGKAQHATHSYSVDIHTLKVLQNALNDPAYKELNNQDKTILKSAILLHDLGKKGGIIDTGHQNLSADYAYSILQKYSFPKNIKARIVDIVENHHWFEGYNKGSLTSEDIAVYSRRPNDFKIFTILSKADLESVNNDFYLKVSGTKNKAEFDKFISDKTKNIQADLKRIYSRSNLVFDTKFVKKGSLFPQKIVNIDGNQLSLRVLDMNELPDDFDMQVFGFTPGVKKKDVRFIVHMTEPNSTNLQIVNILTDNPLNASTWSASLVKPSENATYLQRKFGFIFDVDQANISETYYRNTVSGIEKDFEKFKTTLFDSFDITRTYVKEKFLERLEQKGINLSDEQYAILSEKLLGKRYITQINEDVVIDGKKIKASDIVECLEYSRDKLFYDKKFHSEIVCINPRVIGMIAKVDNLEECPQEFLQFASDNNIPIVLMSDSQ